MSKDRIFEGKRILVLEDDFYLASDEKAFLERLGARVIGPFGRSCQESDIQGAGAVDAALVDINLGRGPEFGFARILRERDVPFVFVTGYDAAALPEEFSDTPRLEKPVRERELITALEMVLAGAPAEG